MGDVFLSFLLMSKSLNEYIKTSTIIIKPQRLKVYDGNVWLRQLIDGNLITLKGNELISQPSYMTESILIPVETEKMDSSIGIGWLGKGN